MDLNPKISIVTPSYNQGQFIEQTILSVLNQTYKNIQYIIIDGGSTDNTLDIIEKYKDRIDIVISEKDKGQSDAINKGFKLSTGVLVGWINSDDILYPTCVEKLVDSYLKNPNTAIFYCSNLNIIDAFGRIIAKANRTIKDKDYLLKKDYTVHQPTSFYNNHLLKKVNYVDESINFCMDLDLWLRLLDYSDIVSFSDEPQGAFRKWGETKTSTGTLKFLKEVRLTLLKYGTKFYNRLIISTHIDALKYKVKRLLKII
ncbi:glycosyltransferase [Bacteroidales bacterium OttesenSCG-928-I14]|nr:glycosyltransferase [Bacteroidales bacterium OttesenSCG-928-I14]